MDDEYVDKLTEWSNQSFFSITEWCMYTSKT